MQDNIYSEKQSTDAKLIYTMGFLWNDINDKIDKTLKPYDLNSAKLYLGQAACYSVKHNKNARQA